MHRCKICNFETYRLNDYNRHLNTKKHNNNISKGCSTIIDTNKNVDNHTNIDTQFGHSCEKCGKIYKHYQTKWTHKQTCGKQATHIETIMKELIEIKSKINSQQPINCTNDMSINNSNNITDNKVINNQKTINVVAYVNAHYLNVEPLKPICQNQITQMITMTPEESGNHSFCEFLVYNHDKKILHEFLGRIITDAYKKTNPTEQQFWATDVARLTFVVRQVLNKSKIWLTDKKGAHITSYIITPFLDELNAMLIDHIKICRTKNDNIFMSSTDLEKYSNQMLSAREIILEIANQVLHQQILKHITPKFQITTNLLQL